MEPFTEVVIRCQVNTDLPDGTYLATTPPELEEPIMIGKALVNPGFLRTVPILILNLTRKTITFLPDKLIAQLESIDNPENIIKPGPIKSRTYQWVNSCIQSPEPELLEQLDLSQTILSTEGQNELINLIGQYSEIFGEQSDYRGSVTHRIDLIPGTG